MTGKEEEAAKKEEKRNKKNISKRSESEGGREGRLEIRRYLCGGWLVIAGRKTSPFYLPQGKMLRFPCDIKHVSNDVLYARERNPPIPF